MRLTFRHRLFLGLIGLGTLPLAVALVALAVYVRSNVSPAGPRAAMDEIAASGRQLITALDTSRIDDSTRAIVRRHVGTIARGATLARRADTLSRAEAAVLGVVLLAAAGLLVVVSIILVRRWSAQVSAPVEELLDWTRRIQRAQALPPDHPAGGAPELAALRTALREMATALEAARRHELEQERLRAFRETARRVAHEMRGPLTAAQLALRRLADHAAPPSAASLAVLNEETERLKRMADEFAAFGRLPEGPESDIDLAELVESVLTACVPAECRVERALERNVTIRAHYEPLRRALQNVVRNAVEATDARGIAVQLARSDSTAARITVRDHGPGVPAEVRGRIFEPYVTTKPHGTGLGLAIAQQAVVAQGGALTVNDPADGGAVFVFTLPLP